MLRALVLALLAANLAWFAWAQGWLAGWLPAPGDADQREPDRLGLQEQPQSITVTPLRGAAAPGAAPSAAQTASAQAEPGPAAGAAATEDAPGVADKAAD